MIGWFERHNALVERTVPEERLLVYEVAQGWEPLCGFLDVPAQPFPRVNRRQALEAVISARPGAVDSRADFEHLRESVQQMGDKP